MTQRGNDRIAARQRARARRLELDAERLAREERIDTAVADCELARSRYDAARQALAAAERNLGQAVAAVLSEGEPVERAAALCELTTADVRRLTKLASEQPMTRRSARTRSGSTSAPTHVHSDRATDRVSDGVTDRVSDDAADGDAATSSASTAATTTVPSAVA